jgi:fructose-1,6-bisphosphatase II
LLDIPAFYMKKLAYPLAVRRAWIQDPSLPIHIDATSRNCLPRILAVTSMTSSIGALFA